MQAYCDFSTQKKYEIIGVNFASPVWSWMCSSVYI